MKKPSHVAKMFRDLTASQITDMADRGIIRPTYPPHGELPGQGGTRLYDRDAIVDIGVAAAIRGIYSLNMTARTVVRIRDARKVKGRAWDVAVVKYSESRNKSDLTFLTYSEVKKNLLEIPASLWGSPKEFITVVIDVRAIEKLVDSNM